MKRLFYTLLFVLAFLFYWSTALYIENRTEAEDAFEYAMMVEAEEHPWLYHQHHLLYGPAMKVSVKGVRCVGWNISAFDFLMLISSLSAAGTLFLFFQFCYRRFSLRPVSSLLATGLLAVSHGFWRYAAEAEVVLPASFLGLAALYCSTVGKASRRMFILGMLLSVAAVLMHIMNAVAVFVAIPCFYLLRRRWMASIGHLVLVGTGVVAVYCLCHASGYLHESGVGTLLPIGLGSFVKGTVALGQCVISGDFVLGFTSVRAFLSELFASRMLAEEFYLGSRLARPLVLFSFMTFLALLLLIFGALWRAGWIWQNRIHERERMLLPEGWSAIAAVVAWFVGYGGLLVCIEPGNPELWVMGLIPFWLLLCGLVLMPLTVDNRLWLPFLVLMLMFIHNGVAGIGVLGDPEKDYQYQKAKWILENTTSNAMVVTAGNPVFVRYLRYHADAQVIDLNYVRTGGVDAVVNDAETVYILNDVFAYPPSMKIRFPDAAMRVAEFAGELKPQIQKVHDNEFGGVWKLVRGKSVTN